MAGIPPGVDPQLVQFFNSVDTDRSGRINCFELQQVLQSSNGRKFNDAACRLMISKNSRPDMSNFVLCHWDI